MLVFLTEEESIKPVLQRMMRSLQPAGTEGLDWMVISHHGKADLRTNLREKMRSWNWGSPHFIVLRDNDGGDCRAIKRDLLELAAKTGKPHHIRIVCQELEAWFLGDLTAVESAFPQSKATRHTDVARFRDTDAVRQASQVIEEWTGSSAKVGRSQRIAEHMDPAKNRSPSFRLVFSTIQAHA